MRNNLQLLFDSKYGYRKHHSTEIATLELTDSIRHEIDQKKIPFSVFLDQQKLLIPETIA